MRAGRQKGWAPEPPIAEDWLYLEAWQRSSSCLFSGHSRACVPTAVTLEPSEPMTAILGISAFYHDSAAALIVDGEIVAAAQEERFTRKKHDHEFPIHAIAYCLEEAGLEPDDLDYVGFYDKPFLKFERLVETYLAYAPVGFRSFMKAMPLWLKKKLKSAVALVCISTLTLFRLWISIAR